MPKVIARIMGGLGNQLFIYAAARRLSHVNGVPLSIDISSGFRNDFYQHKNYLHHFNIKAQIASPKESYEFIGGEIIQTFKRNIDKIVLPFSKRRFLAQERDDFDERLLDYKVRGVVYLEGYWQDEQYFKDIEDILREDLEIVTPHDSKNVELAEEIANCNSICLHARRIYGLPSGENAGPEMKLPALPVSYYQEAVEFIAKRVSDPHFFCFADFPEWFQENLKIDFPTSYIIRNKGDEKNFEDLWLMSKCKHFIVANSTFSWWGAWLCSDKEKIVIAPAERNLPNFVPLPNDYNAFLL
jgi:hypothetical protein